MLREEIQEELNCSSWYADHVLYKVAEAVERVENPYYKGNAVELWNEYPRFQVFEEARQAFLKVIKEE